MNIKKYIIYGMACFASFNMVTCDVLDVDPVDSYSDAAIWGDLSLAEAYLNASYTRLWPEVQKNSKFASLTDELYQMHLYGTDNYLQGNLSPDNPGLAWADDMYRPWTYYYRAIKEVNVFLENIDQVPVPNAGDEEWKQEMIGQVYFLRAYFYSYLYSLFGKIPIIKQTHPLETEEYNEIRSPLDEVVAFVLEDCDKAIALLPLEYASADDFGRATKGAAMGVKARTLLLAASPLFDDNYPTRARWEAAATANKAIIDLGIYSLNSINTADEYAALFNDENNPETIFQKLFDINRSAGYNEVFIHQPPCGSGNGFDGWSTLQPSQNLIDKFEMSDGSKYVRGPVDEYPWSGRDLRLYATVFLDGDMWGVGSDYREVEFFVAEEGSGVASGRDSRAGSVWWNGTQTGYNVKKWLDPTYDVEAAGNDKGYLSPGIMMRLAEFYLNYAECQIELGNNAEALTYINMVRERALMPPRTGVDIRAEYEYERQIELVFEGQRWFDLRRWKMLEKVLSEPIIGIDIVKDADGNKQYRIKETPVQARIFRSPRNYWMPIPRAELRKAPQLDAAPYE